MDLRDTAVGAELGEVEDVQFRLTHRPLEPEQEAVVVVRRIVDPIQVRNAGRLTWHLRMAEFGRIPIVCAAACEGVPATTYARHRASIARIRRPDGDSGIGQGHG